MARCSRALLLLLAVAANCALAAAARQQPAQPRASLARRMLGEKAVVIGGGFGGGFRAGLRSGCFPPSCNDRAGTAQTLATLNAQDAVRTAVDYGGDPYATYAATQSASRSAIAASYGNIPYLANQQTFDRGVGYPFFGRKRS